MDEILQRLQNMEDNVATLKDELATYKMRTVKLERELKKSQDKIESLESERITKRRAVEETFGTTSDNIKQEMTEIKKQCQEVSIKCDRLTKLQTVLNRMILKSCDSVQKGNRIDRLRTDSSKLDQAVKEPQAIQSSSQTNTTKHSVPAPRQSPNASVYFSSISRHMTISRDGRLDFQSIFGQIGQFISAQPLTKDCPSFSIRIINEGKCGVICIGVCSKEHPPNCMPGLLPGSCGYSNNGRIYHYRGQLISSSLTGSNCVDGDVMECGLDFTNRGVIFQFFKNGSKMASVRLPPDERQLHAFVGIAAFGGSVMLMEKYPWRQ